MSAGKLIRIAGGLIAAAALLVAACGDDDDTSPTPTTGPGQPTPTSAPGNTPQAQDFDPNGVLRFAWGTNAGSNYDPHTAPNPFVNIFLFPAYDRLISLTPDGKLEPQLAESWEFKENNRVLELKLRRNVVFHDGAAFNAQAVKANFERAKNDARSTLKADLASVTSVEVIDEYTVQYRLSAPAGSLPTLLSDRAGMMVSPNALANADLDLKPVGAGPYRVTSHEPGNVIVYEKFDRYWNPAVQKLAKIEIRMVLDPATRLRALRSGEIDATSLNPDQIPEAERAGIKLETEPYVGAFILYLNTARSEFGKKEVRQALAKAIDRKAIAEALHAGRCEPTAQVFFKGYWAYDEGTPADFHKYDPAAARQLLSQAGLPNGFTFSAVVINVPFFSAQAEAIQAQLQEIGVRMNVEAIEPAQLLARFAIEKSADAYFSTTGGFVDPAKAVAQLYLPNSTLNPGGYTNPRIQELAAKGLEATEQAARAPSYRELSRITAEDVLHIPICNGQSITARTAKVQGLRPNLAGSYDLRNVSMAK
jgi:ABC-type transport system substrate-binding protein